MVKLASSPFSATDLPAPTSLATMTTLASVGQAGMRATPAMNAPSPRSLKGIIAGFVVLIVISLAMTVGFILHMVQSFVDRARLASATGEMAPSFNWIYLTISCIMFVILIAGLISFFVNYLIEIRTNNQQTRFMASITHELKSPLSAIQLYAQSLQISEVPDEDRSRFLRAIVDDTHRLDRLVSNITETGKYDLGVTDMRFASTAMEKFLRNFAERTRDHAQSSGHQLEVDLTGLDGSHARIDERRIQQVLDNLIHNAMKYSDSDSLIQLAASADAEQVTISFRDRGIGIAAKDIKHIFKRFYRAPDAASRPGGGTGLGLFISRRIVESHDGSLTAVSPGFGRGSVFTLTLPRLGSVSGEDTGGSAEPATATSNQGGVDGSA